MACDRTFDAKRSVVGPDEERSCDGHHNPPVTRRFVLWGLSAGPRNRKPTLARFILSLIARQPLAEVCSTDLSSL